MITAFYAATDVSWGKIMNSYLPRTRRVQAMRLAHAVHGGHLGSRKTKARLKLLFKWPTIAIDVQKFCETCHECQKRRRVTI